MAAEIALTLASIKKNKGLKHPGMPKSVPVFQHGDIIRGKFTVTPKNGSVSHSGLSVVLRGVYRDSFGEIRDEFFSKALQILPSGDLRQPLNGPYTFGRVAVPFPTYIGKHMSVVYFVDCKLDTSRGSVWDRRKLYFVRTTEIPETQLVKSIGIQNVIRLEVCFCSTSIDARKCFVGAVIMSLAKLRMVHMSIEIHREERVQGMSFGEEADERLAEFEVMDGAPVRGTVIPVRVFVGGLHCWPCPKSSQCKVSCDYWLLIRCRDETSMSYVKKVPIDLGYSDD